MPAALLIAYTLIIMVAGGVVGYLWNSYRRKDESPEKEEEPPVEEADTEPKPGMLRAWQEPAGGPPIVELDGQRLSKNSDLTIEQQARLALLSATLQAWVEVREEPAPAPPTPVPSPNNEPARRGPIELLTKAIQADVRLPYKPTEIVAQINEVLQKKLADSPFAGNPIRLLDIPGRGMTIYVGLDAYNEIDAIPDEAIRELIRAAVAEWEQKSNNAEENKQA